MNLCGRVLVLLGACLAISQARDVTVSSYFCNRDLTVGNDENIIINYNGDSLPNTCKIEVKNTGDYSYDMCIYPENFEIDSSGITIQYHSSLYSSYYPDKEFDQYSYSYSEWCSVHDTVIVSFESNGGSADIKLKVYSKPNEFTAEIVRGAMNIVYVIVGVIVGLIVLTIILVVVVCLCCCRKRQNVPGTVYGAPAGAPVTATYPMAQTTTAYQPAYQPVGQPGFQQPPPQPNMAAPPPGYPAQGSYPPPQQGGYPPAPQQNFAQYQQQTPEKMQPTAPPPYTQ